MVGLGEMADIQWWYRFLVEECDLKIGEDWCWAWDYERNCWAVQFKDPTIETFFRLMSYTR